MAVNQNPHLIGYWARVHSLDWVECLESPELEDAITGPDNEQAFREGWVEADVEIRAEQRAKRLAELVDHLSSEEMEGA